MGIQDQVSVAVDFAEAPAIEHGSEIRRLREAMEATARAGRYPRLVVERPWSAHNSRLEGEFASPWAIRWYLERELGRLAEHGARVSVCLGREAVDLHDQRLGLAALGGQAPLVLAVRAVKPVC